MEKKRKVLTPEQIARAQEIKERPATRKHEAAMRQIERDGRTSKAQLARLDKYGHRAVKERGQLENRIAAEVAGRGPKKPLKTGGGAK